MGEAARKIASGVLTTVYAIGCNAAGSAFLAWTRQDEQQQEMRGQQPHQFNNYR
ncbi:DNA-binding IclR family transcriptional regulator [Micromonospora ureilytica]|uniref:DNA-binding IclR family transcriptional regulator n=1 Tax=Micromonospora ureilytica TaxID=709868 RepID=A0ABS0JM74_9ACTN|nr:DNA-binding IclR family transcriptional regulator [Micromonospora ureilytica]